MNRLKVWAYGALVLLAGLGHLAFVSRWLVHRSLAGIDRELLAAAAQVDVRLQLLAADAAQLAEAVVRAPAVVQALSGDAEAAEAAGAAEQTAARVAGDPARDLLVATSGAAGRTVRVRGLPVDLPAHAEATVWGAAGDGVRREGYVLAGDGLYYAVGVPAGRGSSVAVGVPVTPGWLAAVRTGTGCDATVLVEGRAWRTTLAAAEVGPVVEAARGAPPGRTIGAGRLDRQRPMFAGLVPAPRLPLLFASAPALRVHPVELKGLPRSALALSQATAPLLTPVVSHEWLVLLGLTVLLLAGILAGLLVASEQGTMAPREPVAAAPAPGPVPEPVPAPPVPEADPDEEHWQTVYREFVEARSRCGEAREPLPYPRFRDRLATHRDELVARLACRSVRFHVHVKDGRAGLKARAVR